MNNESKEYNRYTIKMLCSRCGEECLGLMCVCDIVGYCSVGCQRSDWTTHRSVCTPYRNDEISGLVVTRNIDMGEVVMLENPLLTVSTTEKIIDQFNQLTDQQKEIYINLERKVRLGVNQKKIYIKEILEVFSNNCLQIKSCDQNNPKETRGIFPKFSQIHHSCVGNTVVNFKSDKCLVLTACRVIKKGEQLSVNYLNTYRGHRGAGLRLYRRRNLTNCWGIECCCEICLLSGQQLIENEKRKKIIQSYDRKIKECSNLAVEQNSKNCLSLELGILEQMKCLGLEMVRELPETLVRCFMFGKVLQVLGVQLNINPHVYLAEGRALASKLGSSFSQRLAELELQSDQLLILATKDQLQRRKLNRLKVMTLVIVPQPKETNKQK